MTKQQLKEKTDRLRELEGDNIKNDFYLIMQRLQKTDNKMQQEILKELILQVKVCYK